MTAFKKSLVILVVLLPFYIECSRAQQVIDAADVPEWCIHLPVDSHTYFACGIATQPTLDLALRVAEAEGRYKLAEQVQSVLSGYSELIVEEVAVNDSSMLREEFIKVIESVVPPTNLEGSVPKQRHYHHTEGQYVAFVLVQVPIESYRHAFLSGIASQANLYDLIKHSSAFRKLKQGANQQKEESQNNANK